MSKCLAARFANYLIPWDKFDFGPRLGLAYQLNNKPVLRAGYGIYYGGGEENSGRQPERRGRHSLQRFR